jgi:hypothetical protein
VCRPIRASSGEPNGSPAPGLPIHDRVSDDLEADAAEQFGIFVGAQAGVIERVASILTDCFTVTWPAIEHQHAGRGRVSGEHVEHPTLVIVREVKEAVPGEHTIKPTGKLQ